MFINLNEWQPERRPLRVMLMLGWLNGGGAERVAVEMFNELHGGSLDVSMALLRRAGAYIDRVDPARVHVREWCERSFPADGANSSFARPDRFLRSITAGPLAYRSIIREVRPDVVMSFTKGPNVLTALALKGLGPERPRWIAREGNNIVRSSHEDATFRFGRAVEGALVGHAYRSADCVVANSHRLAQRLRQELGLGRDRLRVIRNPVDVDRIRERAAEPLAASPSRPFIVSAGRLTPQKGHDVLLRAYAASPHRATHDLVILGEGPELPALEALAAELGIAGRVRFAGFAANPWAWIARAELFVLASRWEGFPNALLEAMACGTPVLATDCSFGPGEMIAHRRTGWLVPPEDEAGLAGAMDTLLGAADLRAQLAAGATFRIEQFRRELILPQFEALFQEQARIATPPQTAGPAMASGGERWAWQAG